MARKHYTIEQMQTFAEKRGGSCLSEKYVNNRTDLVWRCDKGHVWKARWGNILLGKWCPFCSGNRPGSLTDFQQLAKERGGKCLSRHYINSKIPLNWQCSQGHTWKTVPGLIKKGAWCPHCAGNARLGLDELRTTASKHNGKCLSRDYTNSIRLYKWECSKGHRWEATAGSVRAGSWCPECAGIVRLTVEFVKRQIEKRGWTLVTDSYVNARKPLTIRCSEGHQFTSRWDAIQRGAGCPQCGGFLGEELLRGYFEALFGVPFPRRRPKWLRNISGTLLELDGYSEDLGIAFEHQGIQHYQSISFSKFTPQAVAEIKKRDALKAKQCEKRGIKLFVIPDVINILGPKEIPQAVKEEAVRLGVELPGTPDKVNISLKSVYTSRGKKALDKMQNFASKRGGKLLSTIYFGAEHSYLFQCYKGHRFRKRPGHLRRKRWCPECTPRGIRKLTIKDLREAAYLQGGRCLSIRYVGFEALYSWRCSRGHVWQSTAARVRSGRWCPRCARISSGEKRRRYSIEDLKEAAKQKAGECLSERFTSISRKYKFRCQFGHEWSSVGTSVFRSGHWCPKCGGTGRLTMAELTAVAGARGGRCLSRRYRGAGKYYLWQCSKGHRWQATAGSVRAGSWCPECAGNQRYSVKLLHNLARENNGKCLSLGYKNINTKYKWRCVKGHEFEATVQSIKKGNWCRICSGKGPLCIQDLQRLAQERGGQCLSADYTNSKAKYKWKCGNGHLWEASAEKIKSGNWCPKCRGVARLTIEDLKEAAKKKGGECLSKEYVNSKTKYLWRCAKGHEWEAAADHIRGKQWCPKCSKAAPIGMDTLQGIARSKGGRCLSERYVNAHTEYLWECSVGHRWKAPGKKVKNDGAWCPICRKSRSRGLS